MTLPATDLYVGDTHALARVDHYRYFGLNFSTDLSWSHHIGLVCKKTRKLLRMLYRNFYHFSSSHILVKLYKSLIRPHIEYACSVWDPHLKKDIQMLENVQKFALRICSKSWNSDYDTLLGTINIPTLSNRRETLKLCLLFNILAGRVTYIHPVQSQSKTLPIPCGSVTLFNLWSPMPAPTNTNTHSYHPQ